MKLIDLRNEVKKEIGNALEKIGDKSMLYLTTDKGYRLLIDAYNMKAITDFYIAECDKLEAKEKILGKLKTKGEEDDKS